MKIFDYSKIENKNTERNYKEIGSWFEEVYMERFGNSEWPLTMIKALFSDCVKVSKISTFKPCLTNTEMERAWKIMDSESLYVKAGSNIITRIMAYYGLYSFQIVGDRATGLNGLTLDDVCMINNTPCLRVINRGGDYRYQDIDKDIYNMIEYYILNNRKNNDDIRLFSKLAHRASLWNHLSLFKKRMVKNKGWRENMIKGTPDFMWRRSTGQKRYYNNDIDIVRPS